MQARCTVDGPTPSVYYRGAPYSNTPTHLAPFRARTVRTMHNTRLIPASLLAAPQFPLPSGLPPRTRRNMSWASIPFRVGFALQRTDMVPHSGFTYSRPCHSTAYRVPPVLYRGGCPLGMQQFCILFPYPRISTKTSQVMGPDTFLFPFSRGISSSANRCSIPEA